MPRPIQATIHTQALRHNLEVKSSEVTRRLNKDRVLAPADQKVIKKLLGL